VTTPEVTTDELAAAVAGGATVLDVREAGEYVQGHVPGARLIPVGQLPARITEVQRERRVYVVCASGNRSKVGADVLNAHGIEAVSVSGGTSGWLRAGHPVVTGTTPEV
jgi:rhodanese-related sulfurtransferase